MKEAPEFSENAMFCGYPLSEFSHEDLSRAFAYKMHELRLCYFAMSRDQAHQVAEKMKDVPIPIPEKWQVRR